MNDFLETIVQYRRRRIEEAKERVSLDRIRDRIALRTDYRSFRKQLLSQFGTGIIAELKQASPSKGSFQVDYRVSEIAKEYEQGGASAISVLTEPDFFHGSLEDLVNVSESVSIPLLRKDFIFDPYQIEESAAFGADAILLIGRLLSVDQIAELVNLTISRHMDILFEIHQEEDLDLLSGLPKGSLVGINNRDLKTFETDRLRGIAFTDEIRRAGHYPIVLSGIRSRADIELYKGKADLFLIGESLIRSKDRVSLLRSLIREEDR